MTQRVSMIGQREPATVQRNGVPGVNLKAWPLLGSDRGWFGDSMGTQAPAVLRARDPFANHPWVFTAAWSVAQAISQAPYTIFRETEETTRERARRAKARGREYRARAGSGRRAVSRHLAIPLLKRLQRKGLEADPEHPLTALVLKPNPHQTGVQFFQSAVVWLQVRGEVMLVKESEEGGPVGPSETPARLWPLSPDLFDPILANGSHGELVGWWYRPPVYSARRATGMRIPLGLHEVIQIKFSNPSNPLRGMSRISAAAAGIEVDLMARQVNRNLLANNAEPSGVITYDGQLKKEEERDFLESWEQRHAGAERAGRTALLSGGFSYTKVGLSPADIQYLETLKWDRNEILAVMGVPPAVLGLAEDTNYATALGQIKVFWDQTVLPVARLIEDALDADLLFSEPDDIVGAFDVTNVEALRVGLIERFESAAKLAAVDLHVPPRTAFDVYGLEVGEYAGDTTSLVSPMLVPVADVLAGTAAQPIPDGTLGDPEEPADPEDDTAPEDEPTPAADTEEDEPGEPRGESREQIVHRIRRVLRGRVEQFVKVESALETSMRSRYRQWIRGERAKQLAQFDRLMRGRKAEPFDPNVVLLPLKDVKDRLKATVRPLYVQALNATFEFTLADIGGLATFELDDPSILAVMNRREAKLLRTTPETLRKNLVAELTEAIRLSETVQQARLRIAQVYDVAASAPKTLQVARTEMAGFMNSTRDAMFDAQGLSECVWSTANDEHVRESHVTFGNAGPRERGFDYLSLVGESGGRLRYPGDEECTLPGMVVNCRCSSYPTK